MNYKATQVFLPIIELRTKRNTIKLNFRKSEGFARREETITAFSSAGMVRVVVRGNLERHMEG